MHIIQFRFFYFFFIYDGKQCDSHRWREQRKNLQMSSSPRRFYAIARRACVYRILSVFFFLQRPSIGNRYLIQTSRTNSSKCIRLHGLCCGCKSALYARSIRVIDSHVYPPCTSPHRHTLPTMLREETGNSFFIFHFYVNVIRGSPHCKEHFLTN